jgi:hypothetical protein
MGHFDRAVASAPAVIGGPWDAAAAALLALFVELTGEVKNSKAPRAVARAASMALLAPTGPLLIRAVGRALRKVFSAGPEQTGRQLQHSAPARLELLRGYAFDDLACRLIARFSEASESLGDTAKLAMFEAAAALACTPAAIDAWRDDDRGILALARRQSSCLGQHGRILNVANGAVRSIQRVLGVGSSASSAGPVGVLCHLEVLRGGVLRGMTQHPCYMGAAHHAPVVRDGCLKPTSEAESVTQALLDHASLIAALWPTVIQAVLPVDVSPASHGEGSEIVLLILVNGGETESLSDHAPPRLIMDMRTGRLFPVILLNTRDGAGCQQQCAGSMLLELPPNIKALGGVGGSCFVDKEQARVAQGALRKLQDESFQQDARRNVGHQSADFGAMSMQLRARTVSVDVLQVHSVTKETVMWGFKLDSFCRRGGIAGAGLAINDVELLLDFHGVSWILMDAEGDGGGDTAAIDVSEHSARAEAMAELQIVRSDPVATANAFARILAHVIRRYVK